MKPKSPYIPNNKVRIVTAAALFDGHDVAINMMRRIIQSTGVEVIHLGHDRSVLEVVDCAIQEDVNAIAITSYQGGHMEYFKYMHDLLLERGAGHVKIFGGGGGVILPHEIQELMDYGITRIYSPDDGRTLGLQGMVNDLVRQSDFSVLGYNDQSHKELMQSLRMKEVGGIARLITMAENSEEEFAAVLSKVNWNENLVPVLGVTGTGGAGKSSLVDELVRRFLVDFPDKTLGIVSVDPSKRKTGGALLGDRIRMNAINDARVYMRSLATRQSNLSLSKYVDEAIKVLKVAGYDLIILETSGIGQADTEIIEHSDLSLYVMTPEFGAASQLEKIDMLDFADVVALNKFDKRGALDALRDVKKQFVRNNGLWEVDQDDLPVIGTIASQFNDPGMNCLYGLLIQELVNKTGAALERPSKKRFNETAKVHIIPPARIRYLSEIAENNRAYDKEVVEQAEVAQRLYGLFKTIQSVAGLDQTTDFSRYFSRDGLEESTLLESTKREEKKELLSLLIKEFAAQKKGLTPHNWEIILDWEDKIARYREPMYDFKVRGKQIEMATHFKSLSQLNIPKITLPRYKAWGDILRWVGQENVPGEFPFTAGLYPFKRTEEDPTRMFAGEGGPERTNRRFHYVSIGTAAKRLSTAFDSVTLYGHDPGHRPDIFGKIGNAGVSICCLDDLKKLYSGFDLSSPSTSVSMTINGPAPMLLGYFMNAAIDQNCEKYIVENGLEEEVEQKIAHLYKELGIPRPEYNGELPKGNNGLGLMLLGVSGDEVLSRAEYEAIRKKTLNMVRGTVQADILKEDQAQNTCIFSTEFALRLMGDVQEYFIRNNVRNFYSVSISGYHIAEAGANPITQLAFTLANGFTYVEYYLSRGMDINEFGPNLSFFFSNGIDAEYAVIGRVARRVWAKALKGRYGADTRAQLLKYHIQTSGRSLHAQEIDFNDIRTTLQALYAVYDNCNSLHTNAYDEAITTPTEESVRRAMAIQLIINKELGLTKNENPIQGSFIIEELTDLVEEAVLLEFDRITERGGVLGAMETMYQRSKIQEESLHYETLKHNGAIPIIGVNTFLSSKGSPSIMPTEVIRATDAEKQQQIQSLENLHAMRQDISKKLLADLQEAAIDNRNIFETLMEVTKYCTLGQITQALFEVGGQYRRNM
ncbi:methylmalonyl-CoA mutase [Arenibacter aquaticus]|uniref:Fused isobutyryl-CoA mutase n=1 Tax=Arenibacter aquaticus TaxID=2489054 RepID=A0A3S0ALR7_9FLAO|nr:methylmalonyl-CoA mutase family protein [Arenibacter aquaticus]RTE53042.1 methylmalonyl-CoA mutase [Arenibacter aquaticus]